MKEEEVGEEEEVVVLEEEEEVGLVEEEVVVGVEDPFTCMTGLSFECRGEG